MNDMMGNVSDGESGGERLLEWWGARELALDQLFTVEIGPLTMWIVRQEREWLVAADRSSDALSPGASIEVSDGPWPENLEWERLAHGGSERGVELTPCMMDRPFLVRPYAKLQIPPGQRIVVFVSTPVVVRVAEAGARVAMVEVPVLTPSETWRGASGPDDTIDGRVCYSGRTNARLDEKRLELRESRAITALTVDNQGTDPIWVDQLTVPAPRLALWVDPQTGALHTDSVTLIRERGDASADRVQVSKGAPRPDMTPVAAARESESGVSVMRLLSRVWEAGS